MIRFRRKYWQLKEKFLENVLPEVIFRIKTLLNGRPDSEELRSLTKQILLSKTSTRLDRIIEKAYLPDISHYITAMDAYLMREVEDPFIDHPLINQYRSEFEKFAAGQVYQPGGMVNSELVLLYSLVRHAKPEVFIESGTKFAYSSLFIAEALSRNDNSPEMFCLSLFDGDELERAQSRLEPYSFVSINEGYSQELIDEIGELHGRKRTAMLIDGPKARSESWDILMNKIAALFSNLSFLCFDSAQEHVPYYSQYWDQPFDDKRSINAERLKLILAFEELFKPRDYKLSIQSNQFCRRFAHLNEDIYRQRNSEWGRYFPWAPYKVDRLDHLAHSYKLATFYRPEILE